MMFMFKNVAHSLGQCTSYLQKAFLQLNKAAADSKLSCRHITLQNIRHDNAHYTNTATRCSTMMYIIAAALARGLWSIPTKTLSSWCAPRTISLLLNGGGAPRIRPARGWNPPAPPPVRTAASMSNSLSSSFLFVMRWGGEDCLFARACKSYIPSCDICKPWCDTCMPCSSTCMPSRNSYMCAATHASHMHDGYICYMCYSPSDTTMCNETCTTQLYLQAYIQLQASNVAGHVCWQPLSAEPLFTCCWKSCSS